nr:AlNc14C92G5732 [Albugo laibachii Nc14]|eukprot:CCA20367.1 AlNc14C92G5732 [Albugo laibachii Nc14]
MEKSFVYRDLTLLPLYSMYFTLFVISIHTSRAFVLRQQSSRMSTRARMTHAQKEALRAYSESHSELTQDELAAWAKVTFNLTVTPGRKLIYRALNAPSM